MTIRQNFVSQVFQKLLFDDEVDAAYPLAGIGAQEDELITNVLGRADVASGNLLRGSLRIGRNLLLAHALLGRVGLG